MENWKPIVISLIVLVLAFFCIGTIFRDQQRSEVTLHMLDRVPVSILISQDATTSNPEGLVVNLDDQSCIPADCNLAPLQGESTFAQIFSDGSNKSSTGREMSLGIQLRMYPPKDTTTMYSLPVFELIAIGQMDTYGMPTGLNMFSGDFEVDGAAVAPPIDFMGWWNSIACRVTFAGSSVPCDQIGYYPDQNGYWIFPIVDPDTVSSIQVNILKLSSNGAVALFPIESDEITLEDIRYISEKMPQAGRLLKIYGAAQYLIPTQP